MRHRRLRWFLALIAGLSALTLVAAGCGGRQAATGQQAKQINIGYVAWDDSIAVSHLYKVLLEKQGYKVNLTELEAGPVYAGLAQGNIDLFQTCWLPTTHEDYYAQYKDKVEDLGIWYDNATLNIAVPDYVTDVNSLADLKGKEAKFNGQITGIDPGAGLTRITKEQVMPAYDLTPGYQLTTSSSTAMQAALDKAIKEHQPIVVTLWHPHWAYSRYPLKDLTDPLGAFGAPDQIHSLGRLGFTKDFPDLAAMIKKFKMTDEQLASLMDIVTKAPKGQEDQAARQWADQNPQAIATFATP
jgi:glycine betaine/proline transport system substrate-binding protein